MSENRRHKWLGGASAWMASAVMHGVMILLLASIVLVVAEQETTEAVVHLGNVDRTVDDASSRDEGARSGAPSQPIASEMTQSRAVSAPMPAPSLEATQGALMPTPETLITLDPSDTDPALALLAELADDTSAEQTIGAGKNPLLDGTSPDFQEMIGGMRGRGLDAVFVLDVTGSMGPYIVQAKHRMHDVMGVITGMLTFDGQPPRNVRFGVVAYKDYGDEYGRSATRVLPLTGDFDQVRMFINQLTVGGGGDDPEPIQEALMDAANGGRMGWKRGKKNIIVLVGDAPVHRRNREKALDAARRFVRRYQGTVSAIDVGSEHGEVLADFEHIARAGKGSAFPLTDEKQFWTYLIVSVFGERYQRDVQTIIERYTEDR